MSVYLAIVLGVLVADLALGLTVRWLNARAARAGLPAGFEDVYEPERYARSQQYQAVHARFSNWVDSLATAALVAFLAAGGLGWVDGLCRRADWGPIGTGLLFLGALGLSVSLLGLPAAAWRTFGIEARFGFNRTRPATFVADVLKGWLLAGLLGGGLLALAIWLFDSQGPAAWWIVWAALAAFELGMTFVTPAWLLPLFYRFEPLPDGPLRQAIEAYAQAQAFAARGIYRVDGSRRSTKANAFFAGFGRFRRIALFDTLIQRHPPAEIVAVLAHEVGHARHRHVLQSAAVSLAVSGLMCWLFAWLLGVAELQRAFGFAQPSVHATLVLFGLLFTPLSLALGVVGNAWSRRKERAADRFAARTTGDPAGLSAALRRLAADSLANLTPHPLQVWLHHRHPPLVERVRRLQAEAPPIGPDC